VQTAPGEATSAEYCRQKARELGARDPVCLSLLTASVRLIRFEPALTLRVTNGTVYDVVQFTERGIRDESKKQGDGRSTLDIISKLQSEMATVLRKTIILTPCGFISATGFGLRKFVQVQ
jgi:hypothetical protein